jgi:cytochrome P450
LTLGRGFRKPFRMQLPPGPKLPTPLQTILYIALPTEFLEQCQKRYGNVFTTRTALVGNVVLIVTPEDVKQLFTSDAEEVLAGQANELLTPLLGPRSVMRLDGQPHLRQRRLLTPPFRGERMHAHVATMRAVTEQVMAQAPRDQPLLLHEYMQRITLQILLRVVFGAADEATVHELGEALTRVLNHQSGLEALWMLKPLQRDLFGLSPWVRFQRDVQAADKLLYRQIERTRSARQRGETARNDMLSMLLEARDEQGQPMTDAELRDELITLLIAGHETTATMLCWAFDLILAQPEIKARIGDEIRQATQLGNLPFLDAVIKEVLRLRPVIPGPGRRLVRPMRFSSYEVPAGTMVVPATYLTHRHPDHYPEPERFQPERFLGQKPNPYAFYPFGGGVRRCLGMAFALYQMNVVIAQVLSSLSLRKQHRQPARIVLRGFTYAPGARAEVIITRRAA